MAGYKWVNSNVEQNLPDSAVWGGEDVDNKPIYVGRAEYKGNCIPGKVIPASKRAYISNGGIEIPVDNYEVLCKRSLEWISGHGGNIPWNAVPGGKVDNGEILFIGRFKHENTLTVGKVHPSRGLCFIPFNGKEISSATYEILVTSD